MNVQAMIEQLLPEMIGWRRHFHQNPELSYAEKETSAYIAERLQEMGLQVRTAVGGYGVIGVLQGGEKGATVALRADIDALPIQDEKECDYKSGVPGVMHACGHDAHTAALLGAAKALSAYKDELRGTIRFLFQPAEEVSPGGALPMIRDGAIDEVDAIYGVHLWSPIPVGTVCSRSGPMWAAADEFTITVKGRGGHGGLPHETVDSVFIASELVVALQSIVSRKINPIQPCVVSVGSIHGGTSFNVIAAECTINGTVRTFDPSVQQEVKRHIKQLALAAAQAHGAECEVQYKEGYPPLVNDAAETARFFRVAEKVFGKDSVKETELMMPGEDFAYYLQRIPGCFMLVGAGNSERGITAPHHHPKFDIDETAMRNSAVLLASMALDFLGNERSFA